MDALVRKRKDVYQNVNSEKLYIQEKTAHISEMAEQYSLPGYVEQASIRDLYRFDLSYTSEVSGRQKQYHEEEIWWQNHKLLSRAEKFASGTVAEYLQNEKKHLFTQLNDRVKKAQEADARAVARVGATYDVHISEADKRAEELYNDGLSRREKEYQDWLMTVKNDPNIFQLKHAQAFFEKHTGYKDSNNLAEHCRKRIADLTAEQERRDAERRAAEAAEAAEAERKRILEKEEAERQWMLEEKKRNAKKKRRKIVALIITVCTVAVIVVPLFVGWFIVPANNYKEAEALLAEGKTTQAAMAFFRLSGYRDARERSIVLLNEAASWNVISVGYAHTVGLKNDGTVVAVGMKGTGQCKVSDWTDIVAVSAGDSHTVGLKADGTVVAVGLNKNNQCNVSDWRGIVAVSAGGEHTVGLKADGTVVATGRNEDGRCDVSGWRDITSISAGTYTTVGLKADGTVVAVGDTSRGKCDVQNWTDIVAISAGGGHTVGLKKDGTVVAVGYNFVGQCNVSRWTDIVAISAGAGYTVGLKADGTVVAVGNNNYDQTKVSDWTDIVAISAGDFHTVGLRSDGTVVSIGLNENGQCNVSDWTGIKCP